MIGTPIQYCALFEAGEECPRGWDDRSREIILDIDGRRTTILMTLALPNNLVQQVNIVFFVHNVFMCHVSYDINYEVTSTAKCTSALDTLKYYTNRDVFASDPCFRLLGQASMEEAEHVFMLALLAASK